MGSPFANRFRTPGRCEPVRRRLEPAAIEGRHVRTPKQLHRPNEFGPEDLENALDTGLARARKPMEEGPPDEDRARPQAERLRHTAGAADTAIDEDLGRFADRRDNLGEDRDRRGYAVE